MTECPPHLAYITDQCPGYRRVKTGKEFSYLDIKGKPLKITQELERIELLTIPPIWENVWICASPNGHIQATGKDPKDRKQYIYHHDWISYRQASKFAKLYEFGKALPGIRRKINHHLKESSFSYKKTLSLALKLLDCNYLRIGNDLYLDENETYGLTTIRRKHVKEFDDHLELVYTAKRGKIRKISVTNEKLVHLLKEANELPGYEIFRYKENGSTFRITSEDVNNFIRELSSENFSAKDFRTWGGTVAAVDEFEAAQEEIKKDSRKKLETAIIARAAQVLGNTIATAREYYVHPHVLTALVKHGKDPFITEDVKAMYTGSYLKKSEAIVLKMIEGLNE